MKIIDCAQGSPEWHAARCGIATASGFADILATIKSGEATVRRNYRARLVVERLTGKTVETFQTPAMRQGIEREPLARAAYEVRVGAWVSEVGFCRHDTLEAGASPDGLIGDDGGLEIKCPELATHLAYLRLDGIPSEYVAQVQGCMWITGREWWDFASYSPDFPERLQLSVRRVHRDERYIATLALAVEVFMGEIREDVAALERIAA